MQSIDGWMAEILTLLDLLDVERAVMVADATGVLPGTRLASEHPERVLALVLVNGPGDLRVGAQRQLFALQDPVAAAAGGLDPA